ncbi:hypothetical protein BE17_29360 [Sorangium cellulosum]|uniref:Uncharacterized protein n=1 Tax=Sorangium cellulosum TaxID=56 RepID=A0A150RVD0_SORCE|nr:hypothetical protein BE17_29360 [Sorangium cellulosum]
MISVYRLYIWGSIQMQLIAYFLQATFQARTIAPGQIYLSLERTGIIDGMSRQPLLDDGLLRRSP